MTQPAKRRRLAMVTGAGAGLGLAASQQLAEQGFDLWLIDRNETAGEAACQQLQSLFPDREIRFSALDLSDFAAIGRFAQQADIHAIDVLLNNAGLFPHFARRENAQGCELGLAVGFYGHFALTAALLPHLLTSPTPRVVTVSSIAHASGHIDLQDPLLQRDYDANRAYSSCKLACLLFARQLQQEAIKHGSSLRSLAAHPGISRTRIGQHEHNPATRLRHHAISRATRFAMHFLGQSAEAGAAPFVHAACAPDLRGGEFIGPAGWFQFKGPPAIVQANRRVLQKQDAAALWRLAEQVTGQHFHWPSTDATT